VQEEGQALTCTVQPYRWQLPSPTAFHFEFLGKTCCKTQGKPTTQVLPQEGTAPSALLPSGGNRSCTNQINAENVCAGKNATSSAPRFPETEATRRYITACGCKLQPCAAGSKRNELYFAVIWRQTEHESKQQYGCENGHLRVIIDCTKT
jgi:hypothetical protein